jgi:hypothetical protein
MADNQQAMWGKLLSTMASIESHLAQAKQAQAQGNVQKAADMAAEAQKLDAAYVRLIDSEELLKQGSEERLANLRDQLTTQQRLQDLNQEGAKEQTDILEAQIKQHEELNKQQGKADTTVKSILKTTMGITDLEITDTGLGMLFNSTNWSHLAASLKETLTLSKFGASMYLKFVQATMMQIVALDQSRASMQRATALGAGYNDMLSDNANALRSVGLGYAEAAQGIMAVQTNMSNLALLSREAQADLSLAAAANEQLGISADVTARNMNTMMQAMGMTTEAAISHSNELASLAISLGRPPRQVAEDFAAAAPQLARFGSRMTGVFEELQIQAAATGVSMQELLNIAERMDTFEGAAEAAGRLNAILGGGVLNSMDLLAAEGPDKIRLIQEAFGRAGISMGELDQRTQRYVASVLGTDALQANRLLTGSIGDQEAALRSLRLEEEDLEAQREQAASIQQKLTALMSAFGVAVMPLVEMITGVLTPLSQLITKNKLLFQVLSSIVIGWSLYRKMMMARAALAAAELPTLAAKTLAYKELGKAKAKAAVAGRGAGAGGILGIGAIPILLTVAALVLAIGVAIGVAAFGMSKLVEAFADFAEAISVEKMRALAMLGIAAPGFLLAAAALPFLALGIGALAGALMLLPEQKLVSLQGSFEAIDGAITAVAEAPDAPLKIMAVIDKASELADKQLELRTDVLSATADMITSTFAEAFGSEGRATQDVVLVLKDREFARAVNAVVDHNLGVVTR